jgi:hypothetical protein
LGGRKDNAAGARQGFGLRIFGRLRPCRCHFAPLKDWAKSSAEIWRPSLS